MARVRDRTEDFKDAVRHTAVSLGYDEVCLRFQLIKLKLLLRCFTSRVIWKIGIIAGRF